MLLEVPGGLVNYQVPRDGARVNGGIRATPDGERAGTVFKFVVDKIDARNEEISRSR